MPRPPFFAFYPADFANDFHVEAMSTLQVGAYLLLLCKAWQAEPPASLPNDDQVLARFARVTPEVWAEIKPGVLAPFRLGTDGRLHSKRLRQEYDTALGKMRVRSASGKLGSSSRWKIPQKMTPPMANGCLPHGIQKETETEEIHDPGDGRPPRTSEVLGAWNASPPLPHLGRFPSTARADLAERWKDKDFREKWQDAIKALSRSPYHCGENDDSFIATLPWFLTENGWKKSTILLGKQEALAAVRPAAVGRSKMMDHEGFAPSRPPGVTDAAG